MCNFFIKFLGKEKQKLINKVVCVTLEHKAAGFHGHKGQAFDGVTKEGWDYERPFF